MRHPIRPILAAGLLIAVLIGAYAVIRQISQPLVPVTQIERTSLASFSENDVAVEIVWEQNLAGQTWLVGTFTPLLEHYHLYSKDLPRTGLNGQGRPTLLEITSLNSVKLIGALMVDQEIVGYYNQVIDKSVPIYPEGPVTLRQQIEIKEGLPSGPIELSITYMSCSDLMCSTPVMGKKVQVVIPPDLE